MTEKAQIAKFYTFYFSLEEKNIKILNQICFKWMKKL